MKKQVEKPISVFFEFPIFRHSTHTIRRVVSILTFLLLYYRNRDSSGGYLGMCVATASTIFGPARVCVCQSHICVIFFSL